MNLYTEDQVFTIFQRFVEEDMGIKLSIEEIQEYYEFHTECKLKIDRKEIENLMNNDDVGSIEIKF